MFVADASGKSNVFDVQNPIQSKVLFHVVDVAMRYKIETAPRFSQAGWRDLPSSSPLCAPVIHDDDGLTDFDGCD